MRQQAPPPRGNRKPRSASGPRPNRQKQAKPEQQKLADKELRKRGNVTYVIEKQPRSIPWRWVIAIILVFAGAIFSAYTYAQIHSVQREINVSRNNLTNQQAENRYLELQLVGNYPREELERMAYERLDMREPDQSQILYFHAPQRGVVSFAIEDPTPAPNISFWQNIAAFFQGIWANVSG